MFNIAFCFIFVNLTILSFASELGNPYSYDHNSPDSIIHHKSNRVASLRAGGRTRASEFNQSLADGRFIFKSPSTKDHSPAAMWEAGSTVDIEWECPKTAENSHNQDLRIQSKTRKTGGYITLAETLPNYSWMNWTIPANFEQGNYFITIEDDEAHTGGYKRCMGETYFPYYFQVYLGRHYIGIISSIGIGHECIL
jgi:hypothetical protein